MKRFKKSYLILLSIGLLVMNTGSLLNHFITVNGDIIDFSKGVGISMVVASLWLFARSKNVAPCRSS